MPAIQVARTDTFEQQRQKINEIGSQVFTITQGGSDLSTGNLKLGDGTRTTPSLAFVSDSSLGIYKSDQKTIGYVSDGKKIIDISPNGFYSYRDFIIQRRQLSDLGINVTSSGSGYETGNYSDIPIIGGSGEGAIADVTVLEYVGSITNSGDQYNSGTYASVSLSGGSGSGASASFSVSGLEVNITNPGSNYGSVDIDGNRTIVYFAVPLINISGSGTGAIVDVFLSNNTGEVETISIVDSGQGYEIGDILSVDNSNLDNSGSGLQLEVTLKPGVVENFSIENYGTNYQPEDILTLPETVSNISTTLSTLLSSVTVSDASGIDVGFLVEQVSGTGQIDVGTSVVSIEGNVINISNPPVVDGSAVLNFIPQFGEGSPSFSYTISELGVIDSIIITEGGNGYNVGDIISVNSFELTQSITKVVTVLSVQELTFASVLPSSTFSPGDTVKLQDGDVVIVDLISSSTVPAGADVTYTGVSSTTNGSGTGATFNVIRDSQGDVLAVTTNNGGKGYSIGDSITISGVNVGGASPADNITLDVLSILENSPGEIYQVNSSGGNITSILIEDLFLSDGDIIVKSGSSIPYQTNTASASGFRYAIDGSITPNLTLYVGNTYTFDLSDSSNTSHTFSLSKFPDGPYYPSLIENISSTLSNTSAQITVADTTNILAGMLVEVTDGVGSLNQGGETTVFSVDSSTQLTLSSIPSTSGEVSLKFYGSEYTDGITRDASSLSILITENTPTLYYYCPEHEDMGGGDEVESSLTIDPNNPKTFGSGFSVLVSDIDSTDVISGDYEGNLKSVNFTVEQLNSVNITNTEVISSNSIESASITTAIIDSSSSNLSIDVTNVNFTGNLTVNSSLSINSTNGNITTSGEVKTTDGIDVNSKLFIRDNIISAASDVNLNLRPAIGKVVEILSSTALAIPTGTTGERPNPPIGTGDGYIRFNTETNQYEGYSESNQSWSSLGGVRDLDGNTTILAEETVGANDNTLWFINDNINTLKVTPQALQFENIKSIASSNTSAPEYFNWTSNTPVLLGQYLKFGNNLYEVTLSGTTASSGNPPIHTSGSLVNGTAELTYWGLSVAPLSFNDIEVVKIGEQSGTPLSINNDLRLSQNVISTDINDLVIRPNSGKKVIIDAPSTLVLPTGPDTDRGIPSQGSVRFSTTTSQFEGYDGTNWGSLGGVKDVDQNTYIIPELSPGSNENILYFFNDNNNTLQLSTTSFDFYSVDTIRSLTTDELEITASLLTFDNGASTFDNTATDRTFLHTAKQYFDIGLSAGLTVDPVLRLDDQGDVYLNIGFGTGVYDGVKVFDGDLKEFELADVRILTEKFTLVKGTSDNGSSVIYPVATSSGAKTTVIAENPTSGDKEFIEFGILDDGTDVFYTEYGNIRTGVKLITPTFEVTGSNNVRLNISLGSEINPTENVIITVVSNITKK